MLQRGIWVFPEIRFGLSPFPFSDQMSHLTSFSTNCNLVLETLRPCCPRKLSKSVLVLVTPSLFSHHLHIEGVLREGGTSGFSSTCSRTCPNNLGDSVNP